MLTTTARLSREIVLTKYTNCSTATTHTSSSPLKSKQTGQLNFLDMTLVRNGNKIISKWYWKPMASNRLLNYHSAHPHHTKFNTVKSFAKKVFSVSHWKFHDEVAQRIAEILQLNSYPSDYIQNVLRCTRPSSPNKIKFHERFNSTAVNESHSVQ